MALIVFVITVVGHPLADDHLHAEAVGVIQFLDHRGWLFDGVAAHGVDPAVAEAGDVGIAADALDLELFKTPVALAFGLGQPLGQGEGIGVGGGGEGKRAKQG